jgi:hypothetical protein
MLAVVKRDRQLMIDQANAAETPRQIKAASEALYSWLAEHPDDVVVINKIGDLIVTKAWMRNSKGRSPRYRNPRPACPN